MKKYTVTLTKDERNFLTGIRSKGKHKSQKIINALILLGCDEGAFQEKRSTNEEISRVLKIGMRKIDRVKKRFVELGMDITLNGQKGSRVYAKKADGDFEAHLVALSCSDPPEGFARWSLRLLADQVVQLQYIDKVSHETIRQVLKKTVHPTKAYFVSWSAIIFSLKNSISLNPYACRFIVLILLFVPSRGPVLIGKS